MVRRRTSSGTFTLNPARRPGQCRYASNRRSSNFSARSFIELASFCAWRRSACRIVKPWKHYL
ncbi:hypothetical protein KCP78_08185 [Salmonella enterica subsp. enterica]|nr:hypothetical protein KCP78_08185 [Salmonella enterica subsp. enterica]